MDSPNPEKNATFFRFEDLRIYHKAIQYAKFIHRITEPTSLCKNDSICSKFNDAARSISLNIAEGSARNKSQFIYYLKMAKSSVRECLVYTTTVKGLDLINDEQEDESRNYLMEMTKMIGALISSLQRSSGVKDNHDDPDYYPDRNKYDNQNY